MHRLRLVSLCVSLCFVSAQFSAGAPLPGPQSADEALAEALHHIQIERHAEALRALRSLNSPRLRSQLSPIWQRRLPFLLGHASFHTGEYGKAMLHFERARETYPEMQDYSLWYLGEGLFRLERFGPARAALQWLLDAFPDSLHREQALLRLAETHVRLGDLPGAADLYSQYRLAYPDGEQLGEVALRLGLVQRDMGNPAAALREWRELWLGRPEHPASAQIPALEKTLPPTFSPPPVSLDDLYRRAQRLWRLHRHREALQAFALARTAYPEAPLPPDVHYQIGVSHYHARDNAAAVETFRAIFAAAPDGPKAPDALLMQARLHLRMEADESFLATARLLSERFPTTKQADEVGYVRGHFYRNRGRVPEAMQVFQRIAEHGKSSAYADDAWWYLGWLQYSSGEYDQAVQSWSKLLKSFPTSTLAADTLYWQGRALERAGRPDEARARYERLRSTYRQTYYGYLASGRLEGRPPWIWEAKSLNGAPPQLGSPPPMSEMFPGDATHAHAVRGRELWAMRLFAAAGEELTAVPAQGVDGRLWQWRAAQAFHWGGQHHRAMRLVRRLGTPSLPHTPGLTGADVQEIAYPLGALERLDVSSFGGLDPLFVGALIMAESTWNPRAISPVGARGLMQLMPDTGRRLATTLGVTVVSDEQFFDSTLNLQLGVTYLVELSRRFNGNLPLILASYNAGEDEVSKWWARRTGDDMEEFIANIPFRETRRYVQRVYVYYAEYQRIYRSSLR
jgi:soluble lytic murein transglycosylase